MERRDRTRSATQSDGSVPRSRGFGVLQGVWITVVEMLAAILTFLVGLTLGMLVPAPPDDPNPGFHYLDYVAYAIAVAPAVAAVAGVIVARWARLGFPLLYLLPMAVPVLIALVLHEVEDTWYFALVLLLPLGNCLVGAVLPGSVTETADDRDWSDDRSQRA